MTSSACREEFKRDGVAEVFALGLDCAACVAPRFLLDGDGKGGRLGPCRRGVGGARLRDGRRGIGGRGRRGRRPGVRGKRKKERKEEGNREVWGFHGGELLGHYSVDFG